MYRSADLCKHIYDIDAFPAELNEPTKSTGRSISLEWAQLETLLHSSNWFIWSSLRLYLGSGHPKQTVHGLHRFCYRGKELSV